MITIKFPINENAKPAVILTDSEHSTGWKALKDTDIWRTDAADTMRRLHLLQDELWPAFLFGIFKASYSWIFWHNNEPSAQLIIRSFVKTE